MLELRPNCEYCDCDLPPDAANAMICTYECTFCKDCVDHVLANVCPNCGGGFERRPIRPKTARRPGLSIGHHPASTKRIGLSYDDGSIAALVAETKDISPIDR